MDAKFHFISHANQSTEAFALWLVAELENSKNGLRCWFGIRDISEHSDPWEQVENALRRCSSFIFILSESSESSDDLSADLWNRAISYNKPITVVQTKPNQICPLSLSTRKLIDFSSHKEEALITVVNRLSRLPTPKGQLESLREQLAGTRKASILAPSAHKARFNAEISAIEQQIAALEAPPERKVAIQERLANSLELQRSPPPSQMKSEPIARIRFVNAPPLSVPRYFENRYIETGLIGEFLRDGGACILTVHGRGGVGKTALACRVLRELEKDAIPDNGGSFKVAAVIYLNATRASANLFPEFLSGLFITLDIDAQQELRSLLENPNATVATKLRHLLPRLATEPTIVLLDNFEDILTPEDSRIKDPEISDLLQFLAEFSQHSLKIIITTRIVPDDVLHFSPSRQIKIALDDGLASPHAERVLRKLDFDGSAGLRDAPDSALSQVASVTRGYPRALEAFYSIIAADPTKEMEDVIADLRRAALPAERLTRVIVGEAYIRLLPIDQKVMQSLAIYARPVPAIAVEYLLADWVPYVESAPILKRLVAMHFVRREGKKYYLHPIDREHSLSFLSPAELKNLRKRAGNFYQEIQKPRSDWKSLEDLEPYLEQFRLRLEGDDFESAVAILEEVAEFLEKRGAFEQLYSLALALNQSTTDEYINSNALEYLARSQWRLGRLNDAVATQKHLVELLSQDGSMFDLLRAKINLFIYGTDLGITDERLQTICKYLTELESIRGWDRRNLAVVLNHVSGCFSELGYLKEALDHQQRATDLAMLLSDPDCREGQIHNLGSVYKSLGNISRAEELYRQALVLADESQNPLWKANHLASIASCAESQGRFDEALEWFTSALAIREQIGDLGGIASNTMELSGLFLTKGELDKALDPANKAFEQARDLKAPLRDYYRMRAEVNLSLGKVAEAHRLLMEGNDNQPGARWHFNNLLGIVLLRQRLKDQAREAFSQALAQSELWLSRYDANPGACGGKALALAGLVACGQIDELSHAKEAYRKAMETGIGKGILTDRKRILEQLALSAKPEMLKEIFTDVFGQEYLKGAITMSQNERDQVFISYAHEDEKWISQLNKVLSPAVRNKSVDIWYDKKIKPGQKWRDQIENALKRARVGVLWVTPDFLASDFIHDQELPFLLNASEQYGVKIVWIYAVPCMVDETPIIDLQCVHAFNKPLVSLASNELDQCILEIAKEIKKAYDAC